MLTIVVLSAMVVVLAIVVVSLRLLGRDVRRLHRAGKSLSDSPGEAGGVSAGGMTFFGDHSH